jgi:hypothetical protein
MVRETNHPKAIGFPDHPSPKAGMVLVGSLYLRIRPSSSWINLGRSASES